MNRFVVVTVAVKLFYILYTYAMLNRNVLAVREAVVGFSMKNWSILYMLSE